MNDVILRLRDTPGNHQNRAERRLARLLKACLRGYGWRCVSAVEVQPEPERKDRHAKESK